MVKILIADDNDDKRSEICAFIESQGVHTRNILTASDMAEFMSKLNDEVGVCVIDIRIPAYAGGIADQNGRGILQVLEQKTSGNVKSLAISAYPDEFEDLRPTFERQGCVLANYHDKDVWQNALKVLITQSSAEFRFDFLVFVALREERTPYLSFGELNGKAVMKDGLSRYDIEIAGKSGAIIELPNIGLVDAAVTAAACIDRYRPKLVTMSGICAGFPKNAHLGQMLISELAYEYQSGKWTEDGFKQRPYQIPISEKMRALSRHLIDDPNLMSSLESGWSAQRPTIQHPPKFGVFTSGSAVIADEKYIQQVSEQHGKVAGLDMEVYAIHRAAHLSRSRPEVICAKVVVDLANSEKSDEIHGYGSFVSSKFIVRAIGQFFS
jgi:nucleoside phosphorylase